MNIHKALVIGNGEVGIALGKVLKAEVVGRHDKKLGHYNILHICFPYSDEFEKEVERYKKLYEPKYTIIHSTVPVGTSKKLGCYHSPIRGKHPYLAESIRTFVKYLAPSNSELIRYFEKKGIKIMAFDNSDTTELGKLLDTTYYGICIKYHDYAKELCDKLGLRFDEVMTEFNTTYNQGYIKLGEPQFVRPVLKPSGGKIGGHCIIPNAKILEKQFGKIIIKLS